MSLELLKDKISYHLENKKISVAEFERSAGLKQSAVRNILYGKSKSPTIDTIQVIAREMKISVDELLSSKNDSMSNDDPVDIGVLRKVTSEVTTMLNNRKSNLCLREIICLFEEAYKYSIHKGKVDADFIAWLVINKTKP